MTLLLGSSTDDVTESIPEELVGCPAEDEYSELNVDSARLLASIEDGPT